MKISQSLWRCRLFLVTLLFLPMTAIAADWVLIAADENTEIEVDRQSARPNKSAWFRYTNTPPASEPCGSGKRVAHSKIYVEANCKEFVIRLKQSIAYSADGEVLSLCGFDTPLASFREFAPETLGEVYFNAICSPGGRDENFIARITRRIKVAQKQAEEAAKQEAEKVANRKREEEEVRANPNLKPQGSACSRSSECAGLLVCAKTSATQMQCMSSDAAIRLNENF